MGGREKDADGVGGHRPEQDSVRDAPDCEGCRQRDELLAEFTQEATAAKTAAARAALVRPRVARRRRKRVRR